MATMSATGSRRSPNWTTAAGGPIRCSCGVAGPLDIDELAATLGPFPSEADALPAVADRLLA
jgi:hypothetical protein